MDNTSTDEELITSFQKLLISTSGNKETLEAFNSILHEELEKVSNSGDTTPQNDTVEKSESHDKLALENLVTHYPSYVNSEFIIDNKILEDLEQCYDGLHGNTKYIWLSCQQNEYKFGGNKFQSQELNSFPGILTLRNQLNSDFNMQFDSCLLIRYKGSSHMLTLHQDDEELFDMLVEKYGPEPAIICPLTI